MKILYLGYKDCKLLDFLTAENEVILCDQKLNLQYCKSLDCELVVSYGYRHIVSKEIIDFFDNKIINLHISFLPFNRGSMPNVWSIIDNTKQGVSIHYMDEGVDTGDILYQKEVFIQDHETLKESYDRLNINVQDLFIEHWSEIKNFKVKPYKQQGVGKTHFLNKTLLLLRLLEIDWSSTVAELKQKTDEQIINEIQHIRAKNNEHWMDVVKLAFEKSPEEARSIFKKIKLCDEHVNSLLRELSENDQR